MATNANAPGMPLPVHTDEGGNQWKLANLKPPSGITRYWPRFGDSPQAPLIPRVNWDVLIDKFGAGPDHPNLQYVHDQDGVGQCNTDATAALAEYVRAFQGLPFVQLGAPDLYDRINGGADNGSMLEDALSEMTARGIGTAATSGTVWRHGLKLADAAERARFKALEVYLCPTFDHVMSASLQGFGLVSGVMWYDSYRPAADGWLPLRGQGGGGGHAVFGYKPARKGGQYGIWHQNSWQSGWGLGGRCVFPSQMYESDGIGGWWACRVMTDEGGVVPAPAP